MYCPKCKAKIGLHRFESRTQTHVTQGMTCSVCGYWVEGGVGAVFSSMSMSPKRASGRR
jgi:hypothetical protein